jgi:para-nitrobenzyl esterase
VFAAQRAAVPYVFQHFDIGGPNRPPATAEDRAMSETIATYWTNFAKRGDPNGDGLPKWPALSEEKPQAMHFAGTATSGPVVNEDGLKDYESRRSGAAGVKK